MILDGHESFSWKNLWRQRCPICDYYLNYVDGQKRYLCPQQNCEFEIEEEDFRKMKTILKKPTYDTP